MTWADSVCLVALVYGLIGWNVWVRKCERRMMEMHEKEEK